MEIYLKASTLVLCIMYTCIHFHVANCSSCVESNSTVQYVKRCPQSKEELELAAQRKNCSSVQQSCVLGREFVYHCVSDPYKTTLLEVCAPIKAITYGRCAEFSLRASRIQANRNTDCTAFKENSCPMWYKSTEAYKYPGCYGLVTTKHNSSSSIASKKEIIQSGMQQDRYRINIGRAADDRIGRKALPVPRFIDAPHLHM